MTKERLLARRLLALLSLPNLRNAEGSIPEMNNYFVQAPFFANRSTLDTKMNWNASRKLNFFGRFRVLGFETENETNFGRELQGNRLGSATPVAARAISTTFRWAPPAR